jgi:hypothetical protein
MLVLHSVGVDPFYLDTLCHGLCYDFVEVMDYGGNDVVRENEHDDSFLYVLSSCLEV